MVKKSRSPVFGTSVRNKENFKEKREIFWVVVRTLKVSDVEEW